MKSLDALKILMPTLGDSLVVCCNGYPSRELHALGDRAANFYMIGSMGLAASIGLGTALSRPDRRVVVLDGDGNALMAMGAMANIGALRPPNFVHVILDNGAYASTGAQRTISREVALDRVALASGYAHAWRAADEGAFFRAWREALELRGPSCVVAVVEPADGHGLPRVEPEPAEIATRFREEVARSQ